MSPTAPLDKVAINIPGKAPLPLGAYSHAVKAGPFVYLCGLGARNPETGKEDGVTLDASGSVLHYDIEVQTRTVLQNLIVVLEAADCSLSDVVDVTVYLRNMKDFAAYNKIYGEFFNFEGLPARTTIESSPPGHNFIEIKAIAYKLSTQS
jgi:2-aminomuconate deaminase